MLIRFVYIDKFHDGILSSERGSEMKNTPIMTKEEFSDKYDEYSPMLYRICALRLGNKQDAEDALQNTFIKYYYKYPGYPDKNAEKAWLIRVAVNCCKDFQKSFWQRKTVGLDKTADITSGLIEDAVRLIDVFELSAKNRTVLELFYYEGYSINEIAGILKISVNSVTSRLSRARKKLKLEMEANKDEQKGIVPEH